MLHQTAHPADARIQAIRDTAALTIRAIELAEKIKKNQFNLRPLAKKEVTVPALWAEILAATLRTAKCTGAKAASPT